MHLQHLDRLQLNPQLSLLPFPDTDLSLYQHVLEIILHSKLSHMLAKCLDLSLWLFHNITLGKYFLSLLGSCKYQDPLFPSVGELLSLAQL